MLLAVLLRLSLSVSIAAADCVVVAPSSPAPARHPAVLLVQTPGETAEGYGALRAALEQQRLSVWSLRCAPPLEDIEAQLATVLPAAVQQSGARALVGHGLGGTLAAQAVARGQVSPEALVLLGAPLRHDPDTAPAVLGALAATPLPEVPVRLAVWLSAPWPEGGPHSTAEVLLGSPLLPGEPVPVAWLALLQRWSSVAWQIDLRAAEDTAIWACSGGLDNLAPAEVVRPQVPAGSFHRYGYLSLDDHDPDNAGLLREREALRALARWLRRTL